MAKKIRADVAAETAGLIESRNKAQTSIMAGELWLDDTRIAKPSTPIAVEDISRLELRRKRQGYVGRGAEKLFPVLQQSGITVSGKRCIDIGASTGGFTEILLEAGAAEIWAVDVGYGQLHPRLRDDPRVVVKERVNFRYWQPEDGNHFELAVMDVSFISTTLLLPPLAAVLSSGADALIMVKPQFELAREQVPKSGVITDPELIQQAITRVMQAAEVAGFTTVKTYPAGVPGRRGNQEIFLHLSFPAE